MWRKVYVTFWPKWILFKRKETPGIIYTDKSTTAEEEEEEEEEALPAVQVQTLRQVGQLVSKTSSFDEHLRFHRHLTQRVISVDTVHAHRVGEHIPTAHKHAYLRC